MPGLGIKRIIQATPVGYLTEMEDGSQVTFPEHVMVEAGYVQPTQQPPTIDNQIARVQVDPSNLQQQLPRVNELGTTQGRPPRVDQVVGGNAPAPVIATPPSPGALPSSSSGSVSMGGTQTSFGRRTDVNAPPPALDLTEQHKQLDDARFLRDDALYEQGRQLKAKAAAEQGADEARFGKYGPDGQLLAEGGAQKQMRQAEADLAARREFDAVTQEAIQVKTNAINERMARVPQEDPKRLWRENNAFQNAAGLMSAMLGGMLAVSTGSGRNMGLEAIERAIDRDINAQRTAIDNEWKKVAHDKESMQQYQAWRGQQRGWMLEEQAVRYASLGLEAEAKAATFNSQARQAEYLGLSAQLQEKAATAAADAIKAHAEMVMAESESARRNWLELEKLSLTQAESSAQVKLTEAQANKLNAEANAKDAPGAGLVFTMRGPQVQGQPTERNVYIRPDVLAGMPPAAQATYRTEMGQELAKHMEIVESLQDYRQKVHELGRKYAGKGTSTRWAPADVKVVKDMQNRLAATITKGLSGAQATDTERQVIKNFTGDPAGWTGQDPQHTQNQYVESMLKSAEINLSNRGAVMQDGSRFEPSREWGRPLHTAAQDPNLGKAVQSGVRTILTGDDPAAALAEADSLINTANSSLVAGHANLNAAFADVKVGKVGDKTTTTFSSRSDDGTVSSVGEAKDLDASVKLMRAGMARQISLAKAAGNDALAAELQNKTNELEKAMRRPATEFDDPYKGVPEVPSGGLRR